MAAKKRTAKKKTTASSATKRSRRPAIGGAELFYTRSQLDGRGRIVTVEIDASGAGAGHRYVRADLELVDLDHSGATYEGRVFLNNPKANAASPLDARAGYAGSFQVFGHGKCFGDAGHCAVPSRYRPEDLRRPHMLERITEVVTITDAIRAAASKSPKVKVTIVPVLRAATTKCDLDDVIRLECIRLVTYNA